LLLAKVEMVETMMFVVAFINLAVAVAVVV
jgi:hypothetical protein